MDTNNNSAPAPSPSLMEHMRNRQKYWAAGKAVPMGDGGLAVFVDSDPGGKSRYVAKRGDTVVVIDYQGILNGDEQTSLFQKVPGPVPGKGWIETPKGGWLVSVSPGSTICQVDVSPPPTEFREGETYPFWQLRTGQTYLSREGQLYVKNLAFTGRRLFPDGTVETEYVTFAYDCEVTIAGEPVIICGARAYQEAKIREVFTAGERSPEAFLQVIREAFHNRHEKAVELSGLFRPEYEETIFGSRFDLPRSVTLSVREWKVIKALLQEAGEYDLIEKVDKRR